MKKQTGFTLIELMVVMAIIAILATAGLSAYTGYIKKARDATRMEDVRAMNTIIQGALSTNGMPPASMDTVVTAANNNQMLTDPLGTKAVCLTTTSLSTVGACGYTYYLCDGGAGYIITAKFESKSNQSSYSAKGSLIGYSMGSCTTVDPPPGNPDGTACSAALWNDSSCINLVCAYYIVTSSYKCTGLLANGALIPYYCELNAQCQSWYCNPSNRCQ